MLKNTTIENAKPKEKEYVILDDGLYLKVMPSKKKKWVVRMFQRGYESKKVIGEYPVVSLAEARAERDRMKLCLRNGVEEIRPALTFKALSDRWYTEKMAPMRAESYLSTICLRLNYLCPIFETPLKDLTRKACAECIYPLAQSGRVETARRTASIVKQVLDFAVGIGEADYNIGTQLIKALPIIPEYKKQHFASN